MNEFRAQIKDNQQTYLTRTEFSIQHAKLEEEITMLRDYKSTMEGKASMNSVYGAYFVSILGTLVGLIGLMKHKKD